MRLAPRGDNLLERLALRLNLAPQPVIDLNWGMGGARVLIAASRLGILAELANGPATLAEIAARRGLAPEPTGLLLSALTDLGHLEVSAGRYDFSRRGRKWLNPASPKSIAGLLDSGGDFWDQWSKLEEVAKTGKGFDKHDTAAGDPYWRRYITGQFEQARLSAAEVAGKLPVPAGARSVLDVAGGHGWYAAELCRRHPGMQATVLDLPGSAAIGRDIIAGAGMSNRVTHIDGDALTSDLGGPHDVVLCFNLIHHLTDEQSTGLIKRLHDVLRPGGTLAVLSMISSSQAEAMKLAGIALFFYLESGAGAHGSADLSRWVREAGFAEPRQLRVTSMPFHQLYTATRLPD